MPVTRHFSSASVCEVFFLIPIVCCRYLGTSRPEIFRKYDSTKNCLRKQDRASAGHLTIDLRGSNQYTPIKPFSYSIISTFLKSSFPKRFCSVVPLLSSNPVQFRVGDTGHREKQLPSFQVRTGIIFCQKYWYLSVFCVRFFFISWLISTGSVGASHRTRNRRF